MMSNIQTTAKALSVADVYSKDKTERLFFFFFFLGTQVEDEVVAILQGVTT